MNERVLNRVHVDHKHGALTTQPRCQHFEILNAKPDITECFVVIFVEQLDNTLLDWCENRWINDLNAKININRIFLSYNCG